MKSKLLCTSRLQRDIKTETPQVHFTRLDSRQGRETCNIYKGALRSCCLHGHAPHMLRNLDTCSVDKCQSNVARASAAQMSRCSVCSPSRSCNDSTHGVCCTMSPASQLNRAVVLHVMLQNVQAVLACKQHIAIVHVHMLLTITR